jgi:hypothetical protein
VKYANGKPAKRGGVLLKAAAAGKRSSTYAVGNVSVEEKPVRT